MLIFHAVNSVADRYDQWHEGVYAFPTEEEAHDYLAREHEWDHKGQFRLTLLGEAVCGVKSGPILEDFCPG